ncbi:iron-sulfur cluster assembly accessory protein [Synechococcus moorigangaii CMS01]|nr:iron-sulfur cluster assembly accessory protein [Synechococcus moorigangaii CMS01]
MIQITSTAVQEIKRIQRSRQAVDSYLRITVQPGGCLDYIYQFSLESEPQPGDRQENIRNLNILIPAQAAEHLTTLSIDYSEDLMGGGFRFKNSRDPKTCNCGQSFQKEP